MSALDKEGATPLHLASKYGHTETASMLVALGAPLSLLDCSSLTPLCVAISEGHAETALALVALGGDVIQQCQVLPSLLYCSFYSNFFFFFKSRSGVYVHIPRTAVELAHEKGDEEFVRQLITCGASEAEGAEVLREKERKKEAEKKARRDGHGSGEPSREKEYEELMKRLGERNLSPSIGKGGLYKTPYLSNPPTHPPYELDYFGK